MKVLIFTTQFYLLGGAERLSIELAEELNKRGIHADVLSMYTPDLPGVAEKKNELLRKGIPAVHFLGMKICPSITSLLPAILRLWRVIRDNGYDLVETSQLSPTVIAAWATRYSQASHISGLHKVVRIERDNTMSDIFWRFTMRSNLHTRFYAVSDYSADAWIRYSSTSPKRTKRIYNGISDEYYQVVPDKKGICDDLGLSKESRLVLFVGRLAAYKGPDTLLGALGSVLETENLVLLYIGHEDLAVQGTRNMLRNMKQAIADAGLTNRVRFLGRREDVPRLMASSDILVHPSRIEGFGLVLAEAMAAGLPIVASNVEGIPEVLAGTESIMVPPDDPEALRDAVLNALNWTTEEQAHVIEKGKRRAEDFRMGNRTSAMISWFEDVLEGRF